MNLLALFKQHKKEMQKGSSSSGPAGNYTSSVVYTKPNCDSKHVEPLLLGAGRLFGFPGALHDKKQDEMHLNVWLASYRIPKDIFYRNLPCDIPTYVQEKCGDVIFPIEDRTAPSTDRMRIVADIIQQCLLKGLDVGVSCQGGHGRTGLICSIMYGLYHPEALDPVEMVRAHLCENMVENGIQEAFVCSFLGLKPPKRVVDLLAKEKEEKEKWKNAKSYVSGYTGGYDYSGYSSGGHFVQASGKTVKAGDPARAADRNDWAGGCVPF